MFFVDHVAVKMHAARSFAGNFKGTHFYAKTFVSDLADVIPMARGRIAALGAQ